MADSGEVRNITIKEVSKDPWTKPGSNQVWYTVVIEEYQAEPIKFISDGDKKAPTPEVGKQYKGKIYTSDKGMKFYPFTGNPYRGGGKAPADPRTMYTAYAKDVWIALQSAGGEVDDTVFLKALDQIKSGGERLMNGDKE